MAQSKTAKQRKQRKQRQAAQAKQEETVARLELDGETLEFDLEDLTFGEVEFVERYFECVLDEVPWESARGGMIAAYLALKRSKPDTTLDDVREMKVNTLKEKPSGPPQEAATGGSGDQ